jgi:uncharacterized protein YvpB/LysM repeat protein
MLGMVLATDGQEISLLRTISMKRLIHVLLLASMLVMLDFSTAVGHSLPDAAYIPGVFGHAQAYSLSCEARSASDLAAFWGIYIGETEFLQSLPISDNPDQGFVGSPNDVWGRLPPHGYGVHADPVAATLRTFGLQAEAHHGLSWDDVQEEISAGRPVIVWVIGAMWTGTPVDYVASDGSVSRVAIYEHTMLLTGYSAESVQVIDAYSGQYQYYWQNAFLDSWSVLGNMAVFVTGEGQSQDDLANGTLRSTYTVQPGDYLMELAREFDVNWLELAEVNSIGYPYIIYTGQVLHLPAGAQAGQVTPEPETGPIEPDRVVNYTAILPIVVRNDTTHPTPSPSPTAISSEPGKTAIVLHTDTLIGFARSIGVAWHVLVKLNNLPPTYVVHPGEILKIK